jgi:hypothetical protein
VADEQSLIPCYAMSCKTFIVQDLRYLAPALRVVHKMQELEALAFCGPREAEWSGRVGQRHVFLCHGRWTVSLRITCLPRPINPAPILVKQAGTLEERLIAHIQWNAGRRLCLPRLFHVENPMNSELLTLCLLAILKSETQSSLTQ